MCRNIIGMFKNKNCIGGEIMEEKEVLLTQEGYDNLEKELNYLKTEKRTEIAERIKIALGFGDLSENSEYDEAKNAQAEK